jgi:hypothetical protein
MKLTIEMRPASDKGQRVVTETGELVEGLKSVQWKANAVERPIVVIEMFAEKVEFDITEPELVEPVEEEPAA